MLDLSLPPPVSATLNYLRAAPCAAPDTLQNRLRKVLFEDAPHPHLDHLACEFGESGKNIIGIGNSLKSQESMLGVGAGRRNFTT